MLDGGKVWKVEGRETDRCIGIFQSKTGLCCLCGVESTPRQSSMVARLHRELKF